MKQLLTKIFIIANVSALSISVAVFLFQISYADQFSFSNDKIDHILHFTSVTVFFLILTLLSLLFVVIAKRDWQKIVNLVLLVITFILFSIGCLFSSFVVFSSDKTNYRYYFSQKDGYSYYAISERFAAIDRPNIHIYKEKHLFLFVKQRLTVDESELKSMNVDVSSVYGKIYDNMFK